MRANGATIDTFTKEWPVIIILLLAFLPLVFRLMLRVFRQLVGRGSTVLHRAGEMGVV